MSRLAPLWQAPNLLALGGAVRHGFFGRRGGVSQGIYASLNCGQGSRDAPAAVKENRARAAAALGADILTTPRQTHSSAAVLLAHAPRAPPRADALITQASGLAIGVLAADCAPILLCDAQQKTIAAIHAGWRGAAGGLMERTLMQLERLGAPAARLHAAIGPCIGAAAYEVGEDMRAQFCAQSPDGAAWFTRHAPRRWRFNLSGFLAMRLKRAGLASCTVSPLCTHRDRAQLFSSRRSRQHNEPDYGRQISLISLPPAAEHLR